MADLEATQRLQRGFAAYLRDPVANPPPPDIEARRLAVYRELIYGNVEGMLARAFPVLKRLTSPKDWQALVTGFLAEHCAKSPYFRDIPREMLAYLGRGGGRHLPAFTLELAHYEWVEMALALAEAKPDGDSDAADLERNIPRLSPLAWMMRYRFPVHKISPDYQPQTPPASATYLLAWRDDRDRVRFMALAPASALLLAMLKANADLTGGEVLAAMAALMPQIPAERVRETGGGLLAELHEKGVITGARRPAG